MADNYLEKKFEDMENGKKTVIRKSYPSLDTLLHKNRSTRGYDISVSVSMEQLHKIIKVNNLIASAGNRQVLRFKPVCDAGTANEILKHIKMGGALPELHLPLKGTEPQAFIVVCSVKEENRFVDMDLGISLQSMSLKAVEMGLNTLIICAFNKNEIMKVLNLEYEPLAILAVGKGKEDIFLTSPKSKDNLSYYRKDGIHYVPKLSPEDIIL